MRNCMIMAVIAVITGCQNRPEETSAPVEKTGSTSAIFVDVTEQTQLRVDYQNGRESGLYAIVESLGGGCAALDYDRDGQLDVFAPGGGTFAEGSRPAGRDSFLMRGTPSLVFESVAEIALCSKSAQYSHGSAVADADNDGFADILVTGYGGLQFYRNLGDGTFEEVSADSRLEDSLWSSSAAWGDLNNDGALDLYVCHYVDWSPENNPVCPGIGPDHRDVCPPREFNPLSDTLYLSNGDGSFTDASQASGLVDGGKGLGVVVADFDHDNDSDIYVANDTTPNFLYQNDGTGKLTEVGVASGTALDDRGLPNGSMGTATGDFDADGLTDLWVTNFEMETFGLYRNRDQLQFQHISRNSGVNAIGSKFVGFGTATEDFDLDGDLDIAVSNGHVIYHPTDGNTEQTPVYLENQGNGVFRRVVPDREGQYFHAKHVGRGLLTGDFDGDGRVDLLFTHLNGPGCLLRNETKTSGRSVQVRLIGTQSNRDGIGARLILHTSAGEQVRHRTGGGSYLSQSQPLITFGVAPDVKCEKLSVFWPHDGRVESIDVPQSAGLITLTESRGMSTQAHIARTEQ